MELVRQVKYFDYSSNHPRSAEAADDGDEDGIIGWCTE